MKVIIMRGLPGSGKTTETKKYPGATVVSADDFFMKNGKYVFDRTKLGAAHMTCYRKFKEALDRGDDIVIVDNTNTTHWEYKRYVKYAKKKNYDVEIISTFDGGVSDEELARRNAHNVPLEAIQRMKARWQT